MRYPHSGGVFGDIHTVLIGADAHGADVQTKRAAAAPPPSVPTFDQVAITFLPGEGTELYLGQLYFGTGGVAVGYQSVKATFLSDNPGLTLQTFAGIAPPAGSAAVPAFSGFSVTPGTSLNQLILDSATMVPAAPWCALMESGGGGQVQLLFSPAVNAVGFNLAQSNTGDVAIAFFDGVTLLDLEVLSPGPGNTGTFSTFAGYSRGA